MSREIATVDKGRPTPGPWRIYGPQPDTLGGRHLTILAGTGKARFGVADIRIIDPNDALEASANARLIVAAPELYALLAILEWGDDERPGCPFCGMGKESGHLDRCQLNDALSSVRGEQ